MLNVSIITVLYSLPGSCSSGSVSHLLKAVTVSPSYMDDVKLEEDTDTLGDDAITAATAAKH